MVHGRDEYPNLHAELRLRNAPSPHLTTCTRKDSTDTRRVPRRLRRSASAMRLSSNNINPCLVSWVAKANSSLAHGEGPDNDDDNGSSVDDEEEAGNTFAMDELPQDDDVIVTPRHHAEPFHVIPASQVNLPSKTRLREKGGSMGAQARTMTLQSSGGRLLGQSQSMPTFVASSSSSSHIHSNSILSAASAPIVILGHGRPRVRYARRSSGGGPPPLRTLPMPAFIPSSVTIPPLIERGDDGGFFLTEMELHSAYLPAAKGLALGAYQLYGQGDVQSALVTFRSVLRVADDVDDVLLKALVYHHMGTAEKDAGDLTASLASHTKCIHLAQSVNHVKLQGRGFKGSSRLYPSCCVEPTNGWGTRARRGARGISPIHVGVRLPRQVHDDRHRRTRP
ncbi:hypothetical protein, variant 3 [Aphanomyces astaci]|uniref:Uncharacterized protein n=1 Tax=Aphanomyces astaci TaxID=112090 RepID=W4GBN4_APHAT|nr:hypothetical protein, variant 3 [Aphanomyces astaci]ETV76489.1 hypothetical protein, variant 3 [Aphanomyces astaci]|eukprot:XP_009834035.1 hypothetical protein, variant 3 [Aphanomyces astaci]